jgi:hypothetical protein
MLHDDGARNILIVLIAIFPSGPWPAFVVLNASLASLKGNLGGIVSSFHSPSLIQNALMCYQGL